VHVSDPTVAGSNVFQFQWSPDGAWIAYMADQLVDDRVDLYVAPPGGGGSTQVSGTPVLGGRVGFFDWSADGSRLVYQADQLVDDQLELFVAAPDGSAVNAAISGPLTAGGDVLSFLIR
jgi:Tol biopolymer transport system component